MFTPRIERAINTMLEAHGLGRRKAGRGFEATHVLSVALIVRDFGFGEDAIIAAMLHDTLEDTALRDDEDVIREQFGEQVLAIVRDVTEPTKIHPWRARKAAYIEQLRQTPRNDARAVAAADKIHNLSSLVTGLEQQGPAFTDLFTTGLPEMEWYQRRVHQTLVDTWAHPILEEHRRQLDRFLAAARATERR